MWFIGCMEMKYAHAKVQNYNLALLIMQLSGILIAIVVMVA